MAKGKGADMTRHGLINIFLAGVCVSFIGTVVAERKWQAQREHALAVQPKPALVRGYCAMMDKIHKIKKEDWK